MMKRLVGIGMILIVVSLILRGYYDDQLRLVLFGFGGPTRGTAGGFGQASTGLSMNLYAHLTGYLLSVAGLLITILGLIRTSKAQAISEELQSESESPSENDTNVEGSRNVKKLS